MIRDGKPVKAVMQSFKLEEISGVDRPAQIGARVALIKRDEPKPLEKMALGLTSETEGHAHLIVIESGWEIRRAGSTDYVNDHAHSWIMAEDGSVVVAAAAGHTHGIALVVKRIEEPASGALAAGKGETGTASRAEDDMDEKEIQKMKDDLAAFRTRAELAEAVAGLPDGHRTFYRTLKGEAAEAFLRADPEIRDAEIRKAAEVNTIVYRAADGAEYRKNDDPRLVALAKRADEERAARVAAETLAKKAELEKRAKELAHIPGDLETRINLLKALETLSEVDREKALSALKAQDAALAEAYRTVGTRQAPGVSGPEEELEKRAREVAKAKGISFEKAYSEVVRSPEGLELFSKSEEARAVVQQAQPVQG